jgi:RNA polymerase sigma-70 factor (ECF subfamily)
MNRTRAKVWGGVWRQDTEIKVLRPDPTRNTARKVGEDQERVNAKASVKTRQLDSGVTPAQLDELVEASKTGDQAAFGQVVGALQRPLYYAAVRITQHPQDARDIVQRAFLKAWEKLPELSDTRKFRSWLFTIAINQARNLRRDKGRRTFEQVDEKPLAAQEPDAPELLSRRQERQQLRAALTQLPPRQREVVSLRIDAEFSFSEIGESIGCSAATARVNFHHGMKRLRQLMVEVTSE